VIWPPLAMTLITSTPAAAFASISFRVSASFATAPPRK
jgi:hypothetical protein